MAPSLDNAARLAHDVGKYVARTASNLPAVITEPLDGALRKMLIADLYGEATGPRPGQRFATLAATLVEPRLEAVRAAFTELDAIEEKVRTGELASLQRAVELARDIDVQLRALLREARPGRRRKTP